MSIRCERIGCQTLATHSLLVCIPAKGYSLEVHTPLRIVIGLKLCRHHAEEANLKDFLNARFLEVVSDSIKQNGLAAPDFERATLEVIRLSGKEFRNYEQLARQQANSRTKH